MVSQFERLAKPKIFQNHTGRCNSLCVYALQDNGAIATAAALYEACPLLSISSMFLVF